MSDTLNSVIKDGKIDLHVDMETQYVIEDLAEIPVRVELASEFRYRKMPLNKNAYVHSEAYAAGELKHGTISLIEDGRW